MTERLHQQSAGNVGLLSRAPGRWQLGTENSQPPRPDARQENRFRGVMEATSTTGAIYVTFSALGNILVGHF